MKENQSMLYIIIYTKVSIGLQISDVKREGTCWLFLYFSQISLFFTDSSTFWKKIKNKNISRILTWFLHTSISSPISPFDNISLERKNLRKSTNQIFFNYKFLSDSLDVLCYQHNSILYCSPTLITLYYIVTMFSKNITYEEEFTSFQLPILKQEMRFFFIREILLSGTIQYCNIKLMSWEDGRIKLCEFQILYIVFLHELLFYFL